MFGLLEQHESLARIAKRRRLLRLPHTAHDILSSSLTDASAAIRSPSWCLPETSFSDEVVHYYQRHKALSLAGPRPRLRACTTRSQSEEQALKIDAALSFLELARDADPLIKPILFYYSCAHLCGVYTRFLFEWDCDNRSHGVKCVHKPGKVADTAVSMEPKGQFSRLATTCFLLTGQPSCFCRLVTYSQTPIARTGAGDLLESFGKNEVAQPLSKLPLSELANFDLDSHLEAVRQHHGFHKYGGRPTSAFLLDVISLFVASSLARYDVLGWKNVLDGRDNSFRIHFEEVFDRYQQFAVDILLSAMGKPFSKFHERLVLSQPNPYEK